MTYKELLETSAKQVGNVVCMGLDVKPELLPYGEKRVRHQLNTYFQELFRRMNLSGLLPAAFKPNIGYYATLDDPREEDFSGSLALSDLFDLLENFFPGTPVILDSKRGDIAASSQNYADEAFRRWGADAVTVAPYMGSDSVGPFIRDPAFGTYVLNRTSNPGGKDLQNLILENGNPLYEAVAKQVIAYNAGKGHVGAVVGATNPAELKAIARIYADHSVPLLIPGVGSQGGSATGVLTILREADYPLPLVRINSSSSLTHPWKQGPAPDDWLDRCEGSLRELIRECAL
ncbi:MAG: orotidine-5'-phosphate decarboxylase [Spirochaetales bacterium]|nr:orotidine-5'-phosphate decarboxylase [Spirochaetales bacterium]